MFGPVLPQRTWRFIAYVREGDEGVADTTSKRLKEVLPENSVS